MPRYQRLDEDISLVQHQGIFRKQISLLEGVAIIISGTVGAGILALPYAIAQVGAVIGVFYLIVFGLLMMGLNLVLGYVAIHTKEPLQLVGLARKYLGKTGGIIMTILAYLLLFGVLVVYLVGEGESLAAMFSGNPRLWSILFFIFASTLIYLGLRTVKTIEVFCVLGIGIITLLIAFFSSPHIIPSHFSFLDWKTLLIPYGIVLFSFHGVVAIPEAHSLLRHKEATFKKAIIVSSSIVIALYILFSLTVVGVTGRGTTEIATIGLGATIGSTMYVLANIFAILSMGTSFLFIGVALRDSLMWDYHVKRSIASSIVAGVPLLILTLGLPHFTTAMNLVGGVFISAELLVVVLICIQALRKGHLAHSGGKGKRALAAKFLGFLFLAFSFGVGYSLINLFS